MISTVAWGAIPAGLIVTWAAIKFRAKRDSETGTVQVFDIKGVRYLCFTGKKVFPQSCLRLDQPRQLVTSYSKMLMASLFVKPNPDHILIIGLGGGILPTAFRHLLPQADITIVEISPDIVEAAQEHFGFTEDERMRIEVMDGREFAIQAQQDHRRFDLVILDAFDESYIPPHMMTQEFLNEVKAILSKDGVIAANTFVRSPTYDDETATYHAAFGEFYTLSSENNRIVIAGDGVLPGLEVVSANAGRWEGEFLTVGIETGEMLQTFRMQVVKI